MSTKRSHTLAEVFSCEFCKSSKNTFSYRTPPVAASIKGMTQLKIIVGTTKKDLEINLLKHIII